LLRLHSRRTRCGAVTGAEACRGLRWAERWPRSRASTRLWQLLVPAQGAAATLQGEIIRLSGRISHEIEGNGGINWDADFDRMVDAALVILASGQALPAADLHEAAALARELRGRNGDTARLARMAVEWVRLNPVPFALGVVGYRR